MLSEIMVASFLLVCLVCFLSVNLHNILKSRRHRGHAKAHAEVSRPAGVILAMAGVGTLLYFATVLAYLVLVYSGALTWLDRVRFPLTPYVQVPGLVLTAVGYGIFIWSVLARGKYAVSWAMPEDQRLVNWGPYAYVRHPSYLAYFLMFTGLFLLWPGIITILPLVAVPGYIRATSEEEKLLLKRFGADYAEYQRKTGWLLPKL